MAKKLQAYNVTLPIAGHAWLTVHATSEEEAIEKAMDSVTTEDIQEWESLEQVNEGNVCHFPSPWEASAELADDQ